MSGEMSGKHPNFRFVNAVSCEKPEILDFISKLRQEELMENYLRCLCDIFIIINSKHESFVKQLNL